MNSIVLSEESTHSAESVASSVSRPGGALSAATCAVCGDGDAKPHYGIESCLGCKGFFRRALMKDNHYKCQRNNDCPISLLERNSCRACRLRKCLEAGMDPYAVRPDRDSTGRQMGRHVFAIPSLRRAAMINNASKIEASRTAIVNSYQLNREAWVKRLSVEVRTLLMTLLNIESTVSASAREVVRGDTRLKADEIYPLKIQSVREIFDDPAVLKGRRSEMRYEPYRLAKKEELAPVVYRRLIAAIDWVDSLADMAGGLSTDDRIALVKSCFAPLMLFKCSAKTANVTDRENLLCLCNFSFIPKNITTIYGETYHLNAMLVERLLHDLVRPFRKLRLTEDEISCLCAIIVLNPPKELSVEAASKVRQLRNRIHETLFQLVKESRGREQAASKFGNLLLYLPIIAACAELVTENLRFAQTFSSIGEIPLLSQLFGCFPVDPIYQQQEAISLPCSSKSCTG